MANPVPYTPGYSYSGWQNDNPTKPLPADEVDNDFANIQRSVNQTISALKDIRRSDGRLQNESVGPDQLSPALTIGFTLRGAWTDGLSYLAGDGVVLNEVFYSARVGHVSTAANSPANDPDTWNLLFSVADIIVSGSLSLPRTTMFGDGSSTEFELSFQPLSKDNIFVQVGGVIQSPNSYSVAGNTLVFDTAPPIDYEIDVRGFATNASVVPDGSVSTLKLENGAVTLGKVDGEVLDRANHTGVQPIGTVDGLQTDLDEKQAAIAARVPYLPNALDPDDGDLPAVGFTTLGQVGVTAIGAGSSNYPASAGVTYTFGGGSAASNFDLAKAEGSNDWYLRAWTDEDTADVWQRLVIASDLGVSVATLDSNGLVLSSQLPVSGSYKGTWNANTNSPAIASGVGINGDFYLVGTAGTTLIDGVNSWAIGDTVRFNGTVWQKIANTATVSSVAGKTGAVGLVKGDVGLGNVDNTADSAKPISTATQTALNGKVGTTRTLTGGTGMAAIGDLSANRTIALSSASIASLALADSAMQASTLRTPPPLGNFVHFERSIPLNVRELGVVGNDTIGSLTDESTAIQAAITKAVNEKRELLFNDTNYQIGTALTTSGSINVGGRAGGKTSISATQALSNAGATMLSLTGGSITSGITLGANIVPGQTEITVNSTTGFSVGDLFFVNSSEFWYYDHRSQWRKGEMHRVTKIISSTKIAIDGCTQYAYNTGSETVTCFRLTPSRVSVNNLGFYHLDPSGEETATGGIFIANALGAEVNDVYVSRASESALVMRRCWHPRVNNIEIDGSGYTGNIGYGVNFQGCVGGVVDGLNTRSLRRGFDANTFNSTAHSITRDTIVRNFRVNGGGYESNGDKYFPPAGNGTTTGVYNAGVGGHGGYDRLIFENGFIANSVDGVTCRGRNTIIRNVQFSGQIERCVYFTFGTGLTVENCLYDAGLYPYYSTSLAAQADFFVRLGTDTGGSLPDQGLPIIIQNNNIQGTRQGILGINRDTPVTVGNIIVQRNTVSLNLVAGDTWRVVKAMDADIRLRGCIVRDNSILGATDVKLFSDNITVGYSPAGPDNWVMVGDKHYRTRLNDDDVVRFVQAPPVNGDPLLVSWHSGTTTSGSVLLFAASTTVRKATGVANAVPGTDYGTLVTFTADAAALTGTTGAPGFLTIGMTADGNVYFQNRTGDTLTLTVRFG